MQGSPALRNPRHHGSDLDGRRWRPDHRRQIREVERLMSTLVMAALIANADCPRLFLSSEWLAPSARQPGARKFRVAVLACLAATTDHCEHRAVGASVGLWVAGFDREKGTYSARGPQRFRTVRWRGANVRC
jgi:hypothetical protein